MEPEWLEDIDFAPRCEKCGEPMFQTGENEHYYECAKCGEWRFREPTNRELAERGDWSFLEDWEVNDRSDYY